MEYILLHLPFKPQQVSKPVNSGVETGLQPKSVHLRTVKLYAMEIALFALWFGIMCLLGVRVYLAHQSLKKRKKAEEA